MCIIVSDIAYFSSYEVNIDLSWEKNPWRNERTKNVETASLKTMWSAQSFNKVRAFTCTLQSKACQKTIQNDYCKISLTMHCYLSVTIISYDILYNLLEKIISSYALKRIAESYKPMISYFTSRFLWFLKL